MQQAERKEGNIMIGKNFPTAAPLGPWVVTKDEIADPHNLRLVTRVNGEVRQDSNTSDMLFNCAQIVSSLSIGLTLEPGDTIATGTPSSTSGVARATDPREPMAPAPRTPTISFCLLTRSPVLYWSVRSRGS